MLKRGKMDRDMVEFVVIDQLVPNEHMLRKVDAAVDFTRLYAYMKWWNRSTARIMAVPVSTQ